MSDTKKKKEVRLPNPFEALLPILVMVLLMLYGFLSGDQEYTDAHMPLIVAIVVACLVGKACGHDFADMMDGMLSRLNATMEAILILLTVGLLVSSFMMSGTIPAVIYYGLNIMTPKFFLPVGLVICAIVGWACGSSWTATATIGIAFMGIGAGLGINPAITAGMVISGAYVGDKFSPLSDTTNLAAAVSGTDLFDHVDAMKSTTGPVFLIAFVIYLIMGLTMQVGHVDASIATNMQAAITSTFNIHWYLVLPILVVLIVSILKLPGLVGIAISVLTGVLFAVFFQGQHNLHTIFDILHYGPTMESGNELVDTLLAKGGMDNQMWTINLILLAVAYGGALERCGCVESLFGGIKRKLKTVGGLILTTMVTSLFCDAAMGDQFLGIGVPAPLYADKYDEMGLSRNMLSRTLEDCGTLWAVMFPWTACGAYQAGILGMSPFKYFPYAFINLINPIYALITAFAGRNIIWADGAYTTLTGKTIQKDVAEAPEEAHKKALENLERRRAAGQAPRVNA